MQSQIVSMVAGKLPDLYLLPILIIFCLISHIYKYTAERLSDDAFYQEYEGVLYAMWVLLAILKTNIDLIMVKFIYSEKATKFCEISTIDLTT